MDNHPAVNDLVLRIRLDSMRKNLGRVDSALNKSARPHRENITMLLSHLDMDNEVNSLESNLGQIETNLQGIWKEGNFDIDQFGDSEWDQAQKTKELKKILGLIKDRSPKITMALSQAINSMKIIEDSLNNANGIMTKLDRSSSIIEKPITNTIQQNMSSEFRIGIGTIDAISETLMKAEQAGKKGDTNLAMEGITTAWQQYHQDLNETVIDLFNEYVDFLHGLAMREVGFDQDMCQIADELVRTKIPHLDSLTVPSRQIVTRTKARIIRLGFPEWTIWALPLAAYECGFIVEDREWLAKFINTNAQPGKEQEHLKCFIADAFATYTMGPCYACSSLMLFFDLHNAYKDTEDHPANVQRAQVILAMLNQMNDQDPDEPYTDIILTLKDAWEAALQQANPPAKHNNEDDKKEEEQAAKWASGLVEELLTRMNDEANSLSEPHMHVVQELKNAWLAALPPADAPDNMAPGKEEQAADWAIQLVKDLWVPIWYNISSLYSVGSWKTTVTGWKEQFDEKIKANDLNSFDATLKGGEELLDVLNFAWRCRIDYPDEEEEIRRIAENLRANLLKQPSKPRTIEPAGRR